MAILKFINGKNDSPAFLENMIEYISKSHKTDDGKYIGSRGCSVKSALSDILSIKKMNYKTHGKQGEHFVLSFDKPPESINDSECMKLAYKICSYYKQYQCIYALHKDTKHKHVHFLLNSVSYTNGKKFSQGPSDLNKFKTYCNEILHKSGFDIINTKCQIENTDYDISDDFYFLELEKSISDTFSNSDFETHNTEPMLLSFFDYDENYDSFTDSEYNGYDCCDYLPAHSENNNLYKRKDNIMKNSSYSFMSDLKEKENNLSVSTSQNDTLPTFTLNISRNINFNVNNQYEADRLTRSINDIEDINADIAVSYSKIAYALYENLYKNNINSNFSLDLSTNINVNFKSEESDENEIFNI